MYDLLIRNGVLYDGSGANARRADVAVFGGKIAAVGENLSGARRTIDAAGRAVTPGFIDIHRHGDCAVFRPDFGKLELRQGLTTVVNGNCGLSAAPLSGPYRREVLDYLEPITGPAEPDLPLESLGTYRKAAEGRGIPIHIGMLAGAGTIRAAVAGYGTERLADEAYEAVHRRLNEALGDGALGVSLGLGYAPECFYTTQELIRALAPLEGRDIPVTVHMREEGDGVLDALEEMLTVARRLRVPVHISHLKAMGKRNWDRLIPRALERMEAARREGLDVSCDVYPYTAGSTQLIHILPHDFLTGGTEAVTERLRSPEQRRILTHRIQTGRDFDNIAGMVGWENILCSTLNRPENRPYQGMSVAQIAQAQGKDPFTCAYDLLVSERCQITMIDFITAESDIVRILRDDHTAVISDSTYPTSGKRHPRVCGTFARILEKYVAREGALSLEQAVRKMTSVPARALRLAGKGLVAEGMDADLCIFDPAAIRERGTYQEPERWAEGMDYVIVDGVPAIEAGEFARMDQGRVLRPRTRR